ncbi:MAG: RluA family pseudouridine synthase, partial [Acidobacteria bacterium]|nr:RluA family pseudouridine synthase [Acidobacteriota bacterium]
PLDETLLAMRMVPDPPLFPVLHEDSDLLVINKPAGLVCHPSKDGPLSSLIGRVRLHLGHAEGRLVNRLDRETSGIVLVAKSAAVAGELGRVVAGAADKSYWAVVEGHVPDAPLVIDAPLGKDLASPVAIKDCVREDGAAARTRARVVCQFVRDGAPFSVLDVSPLTGRKHQIRIHLAHAGYPIVGDKLYGADEHRYLRLVEGRLSDEDRRALRLANHALHARALAFPWRGRAWRFEAGAGDAFLAFIRGGQDVRVFDRAFMT